VTGAARPPWQQDGTADRRSPPAKARTVTDTTTDQPTPGPQPVITEDMRIRTNLKTVIAVGSFLGGVVIAATVWCTIMYLDVQQLKESAKAKDAQLTAMAADISVMRDEVRRLSWTLGNLTASVPGRSPVTP
jgi:hypothetical protein